MTDKELRKLKRSELLEILFYLQKEIEKIQQENENLRKQMDSISAASAISNEDIARIAKAVKYELKGGAPNNPSSKKKK
ncbi:MAG: hypothetical protein E7504_03360 [Ruminococcus sp.]|nr:hypothetical protein [Ruminococcus sp.]